jgi:hypothetical protein
VDVSRDGGVRVALRVRVERRLDRQATVLQHVAALLEGGPKRLVLEQVVDDVVTEERRRRVHTAVVDVLDLEAEVLLLVLLDLVLRDDVELCHPLEDHVAPLERLVGELGRVVAVGVLHQAGQQCGLAQVEIAGVDVEVVLGGGLDAVRAVSEVRRVEVPLEDPVLRVRLLQRDGVAQLLELAGVGVRRRGLPLGPGLGLALEGQLDELLGDRRAALDHAAVGLVGDERAQRALQVERTVLVEPVVLDRHDRLDHGPGDALERDGDPVLVVVRRQPVAVRVEDRGPLRQRVGLELLGQVVHGARDVAGPDPGDAGERDGQPRHHHTEDSGHRDHHQQVGEHAVGRKPLVGGHGHDHRIRTRAQDPKLPALSHRGGERRPAGTPRKSWRPVEGLQGKASTGRELVLTRVRSCGGFQLWGCV